jgi:hypothetical protein
MEYADGENLKKSIQNQKINENKILGILDQLYLTIKYFYDKKISLKFKSLNLLMVKK